MSVKPIGRRKQEKKVMGEEEMKRGVELWWEDSTMIYYESPDKSCMQLRSIMLSLTHKMKRLTQPSLKLDY